MFWSVWCGMPKAFEIYYWLRILFGAFLKWESSLFLLKIWLFLTVCTHTMLSCSTVLLLALSNKKVFLCVGPLAPLGFYPHTSGGLAAKVSFWSLSPIRSPPAPGKAAKVSSWSLSPIRSPSAPLGSAVLLSLNTYVTDATICRGPAPLLRPLLKVRIPSQLSLNDC